MNKLTNMMALLLARAVADIVAAVAEEKVEVEADTVVFDTPVAAE